MIELKNVMKLNEMISVLSVKLWFLNSDRLIIGFFLVVFYMSMNVSDMMVISVSVMMNDELN